MDLMLMTISIKPNCINWRTCISLL